MNIIIILLSISLLITLALLIFRGKLDSKFSIFLKTITVLFCAVGFFRFMLSDAFIWTINGSFYGGVFYNNYDPLQSILRWGYYINYAVLPMAVFFKNSRLWKNIAIYFCLPFTILSITHYGDFIKYFLDPTGRGLMISETFRHFYFSLELVLAATIPLLLTIKEKHRFNVKDKIEWKNFLIALPLIVLQMIPNYLPQSLFGHSQIEAGTMTAVNYVWILLIILQTVGLYLFFRFKNYKTRYMVVMFLAIALFYEYNSMYLMGFSIKRLPFQLCNLGAYLFLIALISKNKPLFNFSFLANIVGTLIAILAPDISGGVFNFWNLHFMLEHMLVFIVPMLAMWLRIFPRINIKALKHFFIGFTIYFLFCLISGTILNGFAKEIGETVNYFYIFDLKKAFGYFPFLSFTGNFVVRIGRFTLYPLFQLSIYLGFSFLVVLFYMAVQKLYQFTDDRLEMRKSRIDIYEKISGKKSNAPIEFIE